MTQARRKIYLNLYWHMHQPDYRDTLTGEYVLPWTYLHAIKDYTDMAHHLEANPKARVSFNFVPILLDQLEDYAQQYASGEIRDPLLAMLSKESLDYISKKQRCLIVDSCFKSHHEKMLEPFVQYQRLHHIYQALQSESATASNYLSGQYMADLLVWYHLAWTGESIRRSNEFVQYLMKKGSQFTLQDRQDLSRLIGELITGLIPRYKKLQQNGQIEISTTPHYHPILPLLLDFKSTRDAMPFAPLPQCGQYHGGKLRAEAHILAAQVSHTHRFDRTPVGMWPAEGGVSYAALSLMAQHGVKWAATGEGVLANSLLKSSPGTELPARQAYLYKPYRVSSASRNSENQDNVNQDNQNHGIESYEFENHEIEKQDIVCFFRDDRLSDKIGFEYSNLHASDAVGDFVRSLEGIAAAADDQASDSIENDSQSPTVVSVILDGENAWEYYPYNAYYFLSELYAALSEHPDIEMTTFSDILHKVKTESLPVAELPQIAAGSWVYGSFSTWIGSAEKNRGWDLLCLAKKCYDRVLLSNTLSADEVAACERQLSICEGSDWFWWFGDYNSSVSVDSFDQLYRRNLSNLYRLLKQEVPDALNHAISVGAGDPAVGGTMRRGQET